MRCEVVPSEFSSLVPFSSSCYQENTENVYGFISKSGLWLYQVHGTVIDIYCVESGKWCFGHCFGESLKNPSAKITAAVEFISSHISFPCLLLAINQDDESLLCLFNADSCKVVRAVLIPETVTSLDVVSGNGGVCIETHNLSRRLRYMFGVVAIGTHYGHVFFLDLCLDENYDSSENSPSIAYVIKQQDFSAEKRENAIAKKQHVLLHLNVESSHRSSFELKSRSSTLGRFSSGKVHVTAVKYVPSLTTLAVGFNFGGVQLWELHHLTLQYTLSNDPEQPVINFAFQEPENDPRNFCYLWIFKGHSIAEEELPTAISVASLYSLTYIKREFVEAFGALYTELQSCCKRFELPLTSDLYSSSQIGSIGSRLISCQIVNQKNLHHTLEVASANESDSASEDTSLCFLSWEVWPNTQHLPLSYYLAVFDLNQWYQAHMPGHFRCHSNELSPYLGVFSMKETMKCLKNEDILSLCAIPQSIKKFKSLLVSEEFFYPSSLSFQQICFSENGLCKTTYLGFQRHLLFEIGELGPQILLNPKEIHATLIKYGLIQDSHVVADHTSLVAQREMLFQLALEYHLPFFFMKCLREWKYSDSIHQGCTSKYLLSWAWKRVMHIKNSIDKFTMPLFNCSGDDVDKSSLKHLYSFRNQLNLIDTIMAGYQKHVTPRTEQGVQELQCRRDAILCINMYLQVLLWLRSVNVLPEMHEEEVTEKNVGYCVSYINDSYSLRRARLQKLHSSLTATDILLIDGLVKESETSSSWQEKNGTGNYPPPSIYAALGSYLIDGVAMELKHSLLFYLLLDLREINANSTFHNELKKFPQIFGLSKSRVKLLKAFWFLDKRDTKNAIKKLLHPAVRVCDILPWQHQRIIKSFLLWKTPQKALKYINHIEPPQASLEDMKLHLSVLLACGAITQAYEYQRRKQDMGFGNELLSHLFLGCQELRKMKDLMYLPLNIRESSALVKFLTDCKDPRAQELLVIYHLLHCNFFEAAKVNDKLSRLLMNKIASIYESSIHERSVDREALVESLMAAVSNTEKCLVEEMKRFPSDVAKKANIEVPQPLSVSIKCSEVKQMSYSDILQALLYKDSPCTSSNVGTPRSSCFEDVPFLRPPITPDSTRKQDSFVNKTPVVTKRSLLSTSPTEYSSPAKRSRLLDNVPFKPSPLLKRTPKSLAGDIVSLLQTPPIHRRTSTLVKNKNLESTPIITPQSILKKKQEVTKQVLTDFHTSPTPPLGSEDESSEDEDMEVDRHVENTAASNASNISRQIRFELPIAVKENSLSSSLGLAAQSNVSKSVMSSGQHENSGNGVASKEMIRTSFGSLTREPLQTLRKKISFHDELPSVKISQIDSEVEIIDNPKEETKGASSKESLPQIDVVANLDREGETGMPISSFMSNSEVPKELIDISEADSSTAQPSKPVDDDVEILFEVQAHAQSFERSHFSSQLPMRSNFPESKELEATFFEGFQSGFLSGSKTSTSVTKKDSSPVQSTTSEDCVIIEQTLIDEHSGNETFYSPCSDHLSFAKTSFAEPVTFFQENSNLPAIQGHDEIIADNAFSYNLSEQRPNAINRAISFDFSESFEGNHGTASISGDSKMPDVENVVSQLIADLPEGSITMCTSFNFMQNLSSTKTDDVLQPKKENLIEKSSETNFVTELENPQIQMENIDVPEVQFTPAKTVEDTVVSKVQFTPSKTMKGHETIYDEKAVVMEVAADSKCEIVGKGTSVSESLSSSESNISQDKFTFAKPIISNVEEFSAILKGKNFDDSDKCVLPITGESKTASEPRFVFSKPLSTNVEEIKLSESADSGVNITKSVESEVVGELPSMFESNTTHKSRFTFSKLSSVKKSEVKKADNNRDSDLNISESNKSTAASRLEVMNVNPSASKRRFTFSRLSSARKSEVKTPVVKTDSKINISESNTSAAPSMHQVSMVNPDVSKQRFTFSKPISLKSSEGLHSISEGIDSKMDMTESSVFSKPSFTFSKPTLLSEKNISSIQIEGNRTDSKTFLLKSEELQSKTEDKDSKMDTDISIDTRQSFTSKKPEENISSNRTAIKSDLPIEKKSASLSDTNTKPSRKTVVFTRSKSSTKASDEEGRQESEIPSDVNQSGSKADFLLSNTAGTYEEFSNSLKKGASDERAYEESDHKALLSSPCSTADVKTQMQSSSATKDITTSKKKKSTLPKVDKSTAITPSTSRKKKPKGKSAQKIEFSFAEPTSPATPEILEILAKSPEAPLPSFMFSPPMTRGRLRKKRIDESMGSSFCSVASEMSFVSKPPPMDSILEGIVQGKTLTPRRTSKASAKKKGRKPRLSQSRLETSAMSSILDDSKLPSPKKSSPSSPKNTSVRHSMTLRQTKVKHKPETL